METLTRDLLTPIKGSERKVTRTREMPWSIKILRFYFRTVGRLFPKRAAKQALTIFSKPRSRYSTRAFNHLVATSRSFSAMSNGLEVKGRIWENLGPTVLLVHGWETSGLHMGSFIEPLWELGFRVVIFDGPAHGESAGTNTNLPDFSEALRQVIQHIGSVDHIVAHSFGGFASVFFASYFNNDIRLDKMVLISVPNKLTHVIGAFSQVLGLSDRVKQEMFALIKKIFHTDPIEIENAVMGQRMKVKDILVIHDRYDDILPFYNSLEMAHFIPNAQLLATENLGHNRILKNPEVISRIGQFLSA